MGEWLSFYDNMSLQFNIDNCDLNQQTIEQCSDTHPDEVSSTKLPQNAHMLLFCALISNMTFV